MKRLIAILLMITLLGTMVGCKETSKASETEEKSKQTVLTQEKEADEKATEEKEQNPALTVEALRTQMKKENKTFAVAYLGYMTFEFDSVLDFIEKTYPEFKEELPFLEEIPEENEIKKEQQGEVYCLIPASPEAEVEIFSEDEGASETSLFKGSSAEPYLLVCNALYSADTHVTITATSDGEKSTMWWYPKLDEYLFVERPRYANGTTGALDFTPYNEMLLANYENMQEDSNWTVPEKADLENTTWYWDGYTEGGNYYEYRVTFHEKTADVRWNPGYGETTEYKDAKWSFEEGKVCLLTIDFGEFAGVRKYNLIIDRENEMMYIASDATGKKLTWDSEILYRFMMQGTAGKAQPMELAGTWERISTETSGSVEETPAGQVTLSISGSSESDLRVTYTDKEFPDGNYSDKALKILTDGDTMGFRDAEWIAEIDHTGAFGQTYALAIVDDALVLRSYFLLDGAPGVSYETFRRAN